jgi:hypothetical protein
VNNLENTKTETDDRRDSGRIKPGSGSPGSMDCTNEHSEEPGDYPFEVDRVTALRGQAVSSRQKPRHVIRRSTERDLLSRDSDIPYEMLEKASRNLVCSLIERQDRSAEALLLLINDLQYRIDDLECDGRVLAGARKGSVVRVKR